MTRPPQAAEVEAAAAADDTDHAGSHRRDVVDSVLVAKPDRALVGDWDSCYFRAN